MISILKVNSLRQIYKNNLNLINNIAGAFLIKGGSMIVTLLTMPAYLNFFDNQTVLGLWFTILSILNWVLSFDLGIGNGLRGKLTLALAKNDKVEAKQYISSAYILIGALAIVVCGISLLVFPHINWNSILNVKTDIVDASTLLYCIRIVFIGLIVQFFLRLINSILYSLQKASINNLLALLSSIIILCSILLLPHNDIKKNLIVMSYVNILAINLPLVITTFIVFTASLRECKPGVGFYRHGYAKSILSMGMLFFLLQLASVMIVSTNEFLISYLVNTSDVVEYQAYFRIFNVCTSMFNLALVPIWSAVTKALGENNIKWITNLYKIICAVSLTSSLLLFILVPALPTIIRLWLGDRFTIYAGYSIAFVILTGLMIWNSSISMVANGLGALKAQAIFLTLGAVLNIPLAYVFTNISHSWIAIVWANIASMLPVCIIQPFYLKHELKKLGNSSTKPGLDTSMIS